MTSARWEPLSTGPWSMGYLDLGTETILCQVSQSPNKEHVIAWTREGKLIALNKMRPKFHLRFSRIQTVSVADDGSFAIGVPHQPGRDRIEAFHPSGDKAFSSVVGALLCDAAVLARRYVVATSAVPDSSTYIFSLADGTLVSKTSNPFGNVLALRFRKGDEPLIEMYLGKRKMDAHRKVDANTPDYIISTRGEVVWMNDHIRGESLRIELAKKLHAARGHERIDILQDLLDQTPSGTAQAKSYHLELGKAYWAVSQEGRNVDPAGDARWTSLLAAYTHFVEAGIWNQAIRGLAKTLRAQADMLRRAGKPGDADLCINEIMSLEAAHEISLLSKKERSKIGLS